MTKKFDSAYFEDGCLILCKDTGEGSAFIVYLHPDSMQLWSVPMYGGAERLEKSWDYSNPIEAYDLAMSWT